MNMNCTHKIFLYLLIYLFVVGLVACDVDIAEKEQYGGYTRQKLSFIHRALQTSVGSRQTPKLYLIGGRDNTMGRKNDVWSSEDGVNWIEETASAQFSAREDHQVVVFPPESQ